MTTDTNGILLLNKPSGITSFKALGNIKKQLRIFSNNKIKVGHTGTLDSFAEGLLVVLTGKFTRFNPSFTAFDKSYEAEIIFGTETDTLDPGGKEIKTGPVPDYETIISSKIQFSGTIYQRPPVFSAVHINGERAYKKAVKGEMPELPERKITINSFDILDWKPPVLRCRIDCSKGTYIRSIARDLGNLCGSCARLEKLKRLKVGPFSVDDSISPDEFNPELHLMSGLKVFNLLDSYLPGSFIPLMVKEEFVPLIRNGAAIRDNFFTECPEKNGLYVLNNSSEFIAYIKIESGIYSYIFVG